MVRYCSTPEGFLILAAPFGAMMAVLVFLSGAAPNPFPEHDPFLSTLPILLGYAFTSITIGVIMMEWRNARERGRVRLDLRSEENRPVLYVSLLALAVFLACSASLIELLT